MVLEFMEICIAQKGRQIAWLERLCMYFVGVLHLLGKEGLHQRWKFDLLGGMCG